MPETKPIDSIPTIPLPTQSCAFERPPENTGSPPRFVDSIDEEEKGSQLRGCAWILHQISGLFRRIWTCFHNLCGGNRTSTQPLFDERTKDVVTDHSKTDTKPQNHSSTEPEVEVSSTSALNTTAAVAVPNNEDISLIVQRLETIPPQEKTFDQHFFRALFHWNSAYDRTHPFICRITNRPGGDIHVCIWKTWIPHASSKGTVILHIQPYENWNSELLQSNEQKWSISQRLKISSKIHLEQKTTYAYEDGNAENTWPMPEGATLDYGDVATALNAITASYCHGVKPIDENFTTTISYADQMEAHETAKQFLQEQITALDSSFECISSSPTQIETDHQYLIDLPAIDPSQINPNVLQWEITKGVRQDILQDGKGEEEVVSVYSAASQYNGCEAPGPYTPQPGMACLTYASDFTQGPQAQLAFPNHLVETILLGANLGFSGILPILQEETKTAVKHGYFMPTKNGAQILQQLVERGHLIEYPCIGSKPVDGDTKVYEILVAAPATGYTQGYTGSAPPKENDKIEFMCALHAFRAQYKQCITLAETLNKPVVLKLTAVGLGVFRNKEDNIAKALYTATLEHQARLEQAGVTCRFQVFRQSHGKLNTKALKVAQLLGLQEFTTKV